MSLMCCLNRFVCLFVFTLQEPEKKRVIRQTSLTCPQWLTSSSPLRLTRTSCSLNTSRQHATEKHSRERERGGGEAGGESGERNGSKGGRRGGKLKKGKDGEETEKETKIIMQQKTSTCRDVKSNVTAERERVQIFLHVSYHCVIFIRNNVLIQSQLLSTTEAQCCHY